MRPAFLSSESQLRSYIPEPAGHILLKILDELDPTARVWAESAGLVGLAFRRNDGHLHVVARALPERVASVLDARRLLITGTENAPMSALPSLPSNVPAGAIFILPGVDSTLRANGLARVRSGGSIDLTVTEAYLHCPKAFVRSQLWRGPSTDVEADAFVAEQGSSLGAAARRFLERSPFALLGTCSDAAGADLSPRGDPPGFAHVIDEKTIVLPDRPGNRIADSFRNILGHPYAGVLFLIPGVDWVLRVSARASIVADAEWLAPMAVRNRVPKLGTWLDVEEVELFHAPALSVAGTWDSQASAQHDRVPSLGRALVDQVEPEGRFHGIKGRVLDWALARDVKKNLY